MLESHQRVLEKLRRTPPPKQEWAEVVKALTQDEHQLGFLGPLVTAEDLNKQYGHGGWRSVPRFPILQGQKWRAIDNGSWTTASHNATFEGAQTIHTTSVSACTALVNAFREARGRTLSHSYRVRGASRDMWKAYRQIPIHSDHARHNIIRVFDAADGIWKFTQAHALLFGMTGSVLAFNRFPAFMTAVGRRWLGCLCRVSSTISALCKFLRVLSTLGNYGQN